MTDKQVIALARAARAGALISDDLEGIIDRNHAYERKRILQYVERIVCGSDTKGWVITGQRKK